MGKSLQTWESYEGLCPCLTRDSLRSCLPLRDHDKPLQPLHTKWPRVQDQKRPRRVAPTCLPSSLKGKSRSSRRHSVSWTLTRTVSCRPQTSLLPSAPSASPSLTARPKACSQRLLDQSTSHRWSCFSQRRWPEVPTMTTPSPRLSMPSKSTAKLTQKCSNTRLWPSVTNSPP